MHLRASQIVSNKTKPLASHCSSAYDFCRSGFSNRSNSYTWRTQLFACLLCLAQPAFTLAQSTPLSNPADIAAQEQLRQLERERILKQQQETQLDVRLPTPITLPNGVTTAQADELLPTEETPCFSVTSLRLIGDESESFQWLLDHADLTLSGNEDKVIGRCLGTRGINTVVHRLQGALTQQGWVTSRILVEPQDLTSKYLQLTFLPGRVGQIRLSPDPQGMVPDRANINHAFPIKPGDILNLRALEQGLENLRRVPTVNADISITPSDLGQSNIHPTASDIVINWHQRLPLRLSLGVDDAGVRSTGKYQGTATASFDNWWALNDLFYISHTRDLGGRDSGERGLHATSAHYSVPFGYWLLSLNASKSEYRQTVAGALQSYIYSGASQNGEIKLSHLVYRDARRKSTLSIKSWIRASQNYVDDTEVQVQRRRTAGWELGFNHREYIGKSTLDLSLNQRQGTGAFGAKHAPEELFGEGTSRMRLTTTDVQFISPFRLGNQSLRYVGNLRAQWNQTPLVPQDRFLIGSRYTVRGFDGVSLLAADRGWFIRNEIALALGDSGQETYLGIDHGEVAGRSSKNLIGTRLTGAVVGLRGSYKGLSYDLFAGTPLAKPDGYKTAHVTTGFHLNWSY